MILHMGLPITITIAGKWLNSLIFHDDNKCITGNGQTNINVGTDIVCQVIIINFMCKNFWKHQVILNMCIYGFGQLV